MEMRITPSINEYPQIKTSALRQGFMLENLFAPGKLQLTYTDLDRAIVGSACPTDSPLKLQAADELRADFFCQRRELGVINIASAGMVTVDGTSFDLNAGDVLYVGRGSREIEFKGNGAAFYLVSYPAHREFPTKKMALAESNHVHLGSQADGNERTLRQFIHENGIQSCQLVMGFTELKTGSCWNTMPPHTHARRSEVYMYFDVPTGHAVVHLMGSPQEVRALMVQNRQVVLSPPWSIHCGSGTASYKFVWAMGGENQRFNDMDPAPIASLR